jgi:uncharacterized membrane protein
MSQTVSPPPPAAAPRADGQMAMVIYILYLLPNPAITHIVGLVLAYVGRDNAPDWVRSHYTFQIYTFWLILLYFVISLALCLVVIGLFLLPLVGVLLIVRCALGLVYWSRSEPYPRPTNPLF